MRPAPQFVTHPTRHIVFTGKGGVGKTSAACATAVALADQGKRVLLVSTDPASNLEEVLATKLSGTPTAIADAPRLDALNLDPEEAAREYRRRVVAPYRGVLPDAVVNSIEEQLSGSCTVEMAAFGEFSRLLSDPRATAEYEHVVFDTAPTGHTLRLLALPAAWTGYIDTNATGTSCLGPLAGLQTQRELYHGAVQALTDAEQTTLVLVSRPEPSALAEADRAGRELAALGIQRQHLVVNAVFRKDTGDDPVAHAMQRRHTLALAALPTALAGLPRTELPLVPHDVVGTAALRAMWQDRLHARPAHGTAAAPADTTLPPPLESLVDQLAQHGHGVILTMGKGGVGKTTVAAAVAVELTRRGHHVHLTTTDPAAHVSHAVGHAPTRLTVSCIDPKGVTEAYRQEVMETAGQHVDESARRLLEEDLRSPCTEEIAVFRAFAQAVDAGKDGYVVLDTAPTGHTILLLDAALAYHRELARQSSSMSQAVRELLPRLRDPAFTRVLMVTLPAATPVHEAAKLHDDLLRADIPTFAWVINQSLLPLRLTDPVLCARACQERTYVGEVLKHAPTHSAIIPWLPEPPVGVQRLQGVVTGRVAGWPLRSSPTRCVA